MNGKGHVTLSATDLEAFALMEQANQQYQVYLEIVQEQASLMPKKRHYVEAPHSWDHPLDLVIRKDNHALVERLAAGDRSSTG